MLFDDEAMRRTFELSTRIAAISRGDGRSATAAAAYRACCAIHCQREDRLHDYRRKRGLEVSRIVAPDGAPAWTYERSALWNAAELRERNGKRGPNARQFKADAKTAREFMFAFPVELSTAGRLKVADTIARHLADTHGVVADFSIHQPGRDGDERNVHCHMLTTTRRMTADGLGAKAREWDAFSSGAALSKQFRARLAATMNEVLAEEGQVDAVFVEHRSFKARGSGQRPQKHLGPARTNALRRQQRQARQAWTKAQAIGLRDRQAGERAALAARQETARTHKLRDLADRERHAAAVVHDAKLPEQAPARRSVLQRLTGLFGRDAAPPRPAATNQQSAARPDASATLQAERAAYAIAQASERQALADRHATEFRQLDHAATHRVALDRQAEREHRRDVAPGRAQHERSLGWDSGHSLK